MKEDIVIKIHEYDVKENKKKHWREHLIEEDTKVLHYFQ